FRSIQNALAPLVATLSSARTRIASAFQGLQNSIASLRVTKATRDLQEVERRAYAFGSALRQVGGAAATFARRTAASFLGITVGIALFRSLAQAATGAAAAERSALRARTQEL